MKSSLVFTLLLSLCNSVSFAQQTWHVSAMGNDENDGKTIGSPFRNLQKVVGLVKPGDIVLIGDGVYTSSDKSGGGAVLNITVSGTKDAWITWRAEIGQHPDIRPVGWCGIQISGSYNIIEGLAVTGANDSLVLLQAQEDAKKPVADPKFNTNGIFVNGRIKKPDEKPHHTVIRNCTVSKCPGGGIIGIETDYWTVEDCKVFDNAWFMRYGGSGITTLSNWAFDDAPGYHIIVRRNYVWNNKTLVSWEKIGKLSDGNGIILDVTDKALQGGANPDADAVIKKDSITVQRAKRPEWNGRALIARNISAFNGGSGIHTFRTKHVDIINNTTYYNGGIVGYAELFSNNSEDIVILNNIIVPRPGGKVTTNIKNTNVRWDYNLYPIAQEVIKGPHDIVADPLFIDPGLNHPAAGFQVRRSSLSKLSGILQYEQLFLSTVLNDLTEKSHKLINRGAYPY